MRACICKVIWLSIRDRVPSGRGEFKPMEIPPATFEVGSSLRKLGEKVTVLEILCIIVHFSLAGVGILDNNLILTVQVIILHRIPRGTATHGKRGTAEVQSPDSDRQR